jgi:hypothetical protein
MRYPPCKKVMAAWSESLEHRVSLWMRIQIQFHLAFCPPCQRCVKQILALRDALRRKFGAIETEISDTLSPERKAKIRQAMSAAEES